jgi:hypothetical protein
MVRTNNWPYDLMLCNTYLYDAVANQVGDSHWGEKYLMDFSTEPWFIESHKQSVFTHRNKAAFGGIMSGAYIEGIWDVLYVSSSVEQKIGLQVKRQDMTFDDFLNYAKVVYEYNQAHPDKITFLYLPRETVIIEQLTMSLLGKDSTSSRQEGIAVMEQVYKALEQLEHVLKFRKKESVHNFGITTN